MEKLFNFCELKKIQKELLYQTKGNNTKKHPQPQMII